MEKQNEEFIFSYHTFLLPFEIIKDDEKADSKEIKEILNPNYWEELTKDNYLAFNSVILKSFEEENRENIIRAVEYNQNQYFHDNVKKAIHNDKDNIVYEYIFKFQDKNADKLVIKSSQEYIINSKQKEYVLKVSNIRLKIFNTGIAMLIFELHNDLYRDFESIKEINELGRRISLPFIDLMGNGENIACAQQLQWNFLYYDEKVYNFREKNNLFLGNDCPEDKIYMINFLKNMIIKKENHINYEIKPSLDDRMFTCCLIKNRYLSDKFKLDYIEESNKNSNEYKNLSKSLYEYIYIDKENGCTAATYSFRKNILNESIYHRWTEYGTIYGASHTSLVAITGEDGYLETLITRPFLTQYVEIAILVLIQRASILRFQKEIKGNMKNKKIQELQSRYIDYRNQLHFFEVSSQEQGIELYELIRKQLYIEKEMEVLEKNLEILYEKSNVDISNKFNEFGVFVGFIAVLSIALDFTVFLISAKENINFLKQLGLLLIVIVVSAIFSLMIWRCVGWYINRKN